MRAIITTLAAAAAIASAPAQANTVAQTVLGPLGNTKCSALVQSFADQDKALSQRYAEYVIGYIDGSLEQVSYLVSQFVDPQLGPVIDQFFGQIGGEQIAYAVGKQCSNSPEMTVKEATDKVFSSAVDAVVNGLSSAPADPAAPSSLPPGQVERLPAQPRNRNIL